MLFLSRGVVVVVVDFGPWVCPIYPLEKSLCSCLYKEIGGCAKESEKVA